MRDKDNYNENDNKNAIHGLTSRPSRLASVVPWYAWVRGFVGSWVVTWIRDPGVHIVSVVSIVYVYNVFTVMVMFE